MAGLIRHQFVPACAQQRRHLLERRFILDCGREPLLQSGSPRPRHRILTEVRAFVQRHDRCTAGGPV